MPKTHERNRCILGTLMTWAFMPVYLYFTRYPRTLYKDILALVAVSVTMTTFGVWYRCERNSKWSLLDHGFAHLFVILMNMSIFFGFPAQQVLLFPLGMLPMYILSYRHHKRKEFTHSMIYWLLFRFVGFWQLTFILSGDHFTRNNIIYFSFWYFLHIILLLFVLPYQYSTNILYSLDYMVSVVVAFLLVCGSVYLRN